MRKRVLAKPKRKLEKNWEPNEKEIKIWEQMFSLVERMRELSINVDYQSIYFNVYLMSAAHTAQSIWKVVVGKQSFGFGCKGSEDILTHSHRRNFWAIFKIIFKRHTKTFHPWCFHIDELTTTDNRFSLSHAINESKFNIFIVLYTYLFVFFSYFFFLFVLSSLFLFFLLLLLLLRFSIV